MPLYMLGCSSIKYFKIIKNKHYEYQNMDFPD